eukprot:1186515-Prorocentrum_minimum.AAC.5
MLSAVKSAIPAARVSRRRARVFATRATLRPEGALTEAPRKTEPADAIVVRPLERAVARGATFCAEDRVAVTPTVR